MTHAPRGHVIGAKARIAVPNEAYGERQSEKRCGNNHDLRGEMPHNGAEMSLNEGRGDP